MYISNFTQKSSESSTPHAPRHKRLHPPSHEVTRHHFHLDDGELMPFSVLEEEIIIILLLGIHKSLSDHKFDENDPPQVEPPTKQQMVVKQAWTDTQLQPPVPRVRCYSSKLNYDQASVACVGLLS